MNEIVWLRAEQKTDESRTALTPQDAKSLVKAGYSVHVEASSQRAFADQAYLEVGCSMEQFFTWPDAPENAFILGLKELPNGDFPLKHRHIYFAHVFKGQKGWRDTLRRFKNGNGSLYDLEFIRDQYGRRIAAFGFWAGYAGAALSLKTWLGQKIGLTPSLSRVTSFTACSELVEELKRGFALHSGNCHPRAIIIGSKGRCGEGAAHLFSELSIEMTLWDQAETQSGGPFKEILEHEIFLNAVYAAEPIPPFLTKTLLAKPGLLSVIADISCDPNSTFNPLPIYNECTSFRNPTASIGLLGKKLDLIAIDHLPSLLPTESSLDFSSQLLPYLLQLRNLDNSIEWQNAREIFTEQISRV